MVYSRAAVYHFSSRSMARATQSRPSRDKYDCAGENLSDFPSIPRPNHISTIVASDNSFRRLPDMRAFTSLSALDLANNRITDLSVLESIETLRVLDISGNRVSSLAFCENLVNLEILRASHNSIQTISTPLPASLLSLSLANNEIADLGFMESCLPVETIEDLDVSGNQIEALIELRHLPVYTKLKTLKVGLLEIFRGLPVLQFVKFLSQTVETFDDEPCGNIQEQFDPDALVNLLVEGSEQKLRKFLVESDALPIVWEPPQFVDFRQDSGRQPLEAIQNRMRQIEDRITRASQRPKPQTGTLLSPFPKHEDPPELKSLRQDITEMKQQLTQAVQLLYVHDQALRRLWNGGAG
jgi:hypothetical protein